jgi:hypothetical protein
MKALNDIEYMDKAMTMVERGIFYGSINASQANI